MMIGCFHYMDENPKLNQTGFQKADDKHRYLGLKTIT